MLDRSTIAFYICLFITALLPYISGFIPVLPTDVLGFNLAGFAWIIMFLISVFRLIRHPHRVTMPVLIWLPWILYITVHWLFDRSFFGLQSTLQYMAFPVVGMAASTFVYSDDTLLVIKRWFVFYLIVIIVGVGLFITHTSLVLAGASTAMSIVVICALLLSDYRLFKNRIALLLIIALALFPLVGVTRMGVLMLLAVLALHFAHKNKWTRIWMGILTLIVALSVFYSDAFQKKSFYSGKGDIEQFSMDNANLNTNGRSKLWQITTVNAIKRPWLGAGSRADLRLLAEYHFKVKELHNDYLTVFYDYGAIGIICLLLGFTGQFWLLYKKKAAITDAFTALFYYAALTIFISWIGFMYSDNALKYAVFYGNFHFCMIGIVYARTATGLKKIKWRNYD